jgi:hypothetical protein
MRNVYVHDFVTEFFFGDGNKPKRLMAPILPVMKLAEVAMKQIAKPVSRQLLEGALSYPQVTKVCVNIGQMLHYINVRVTRSAEGQSSSRRIIELPEDKAKDAGALFLGEVIVFSLTGVIVGWQLWMSQKSSQEAALREEQSSQLRAAEKQAELLARDTRLSELEWNITQMWKVLERMHAPTHELNSSSNSVMTAAARAVTGTKAEPDEKLNFLLKTSMTTPFLEDKRL